MTTPNEVRVRVRRPDPPTAAAPIPWPDQAIKVPWTDDVVIGIDASLTNTGVAILNQAAIHTTSFIPKLLRGVERLDWFRTQFRGLLTAYQPKLVAIEGYAFGAKNQRETMGELGAVVRLACYDAKVPFVIVPPNSLKLFVTGKGSGPKDNMSKEIYKRFGVDLSDNNQVDAAGLAIMALASLIDFPTTEFQRRALDNLAPGCK